MGKQEFTKLDARTFYKAIVMETIQVTMETNQVMQTQNKQKNRTTTTRATHFLKHHRAKKIVKSEHG